MTAQTPIRSAARALPSSTYHPVVVYDGDEQLYTAVAAILAPPLQAEGDVVLVVATPVHLVGFDAALRGAGVDLDSLREAGRYVEFDPDVLLAHLSVGYALDLRPLVPILAAYEQAARTAGGRLHVFGEAVTLLWERGLVPVALELEDAWNHLLDLYDFDLICGYQDRQLTGADGDESYAEMFARHTAVLGPGAVAPHVLPTGTAVTDAVIDSLDCHVAVIDENGRILAVNKPWESFARDNGGRAVGVGAEYFAVCEAAGDPSAADALAGLRAVAAGELERFQLEYPCHSPDELRWFRLTATKLEGSVPVRVVVRHDLITAERLARDEVHMRGQLLDAVDAAVITTDLEGVITVWNGGAARLYGWSESEAIGRSIVDVTVPPEQRATAQQMFATMLSRGGWEVEFDVVRRDGTTFPCYVRNQVIRDEHGAPVGVIGIGVDLTERVEKERELAHQNALLRAITDRMGDGLCTLDVNGGIVYINPVGEALLAAPAGTGWRGRFMDRLLEMEAVDEASELGHHLTGADVGEAPREAAQARLLRADGASVPIEYRVTPLPENDDGLPSGWVVVFRDISERLEQQRQLRSHAESAQWLTRIQDALDHHRFVLHAQPIVDLATREIIQHELLIRLDDPEEGLIYPGAFLPTAEAYGLAPAIDRWVITRAIGIAAAGHPVEINLSARSFADPSLPYLIEQLLADSGVDPHLLVFELTETALLENDQEAARFAARMHTMGCKLALDDFGTGYGAFTYLKQLPVDLLKIDIEFVRDAVTDPASRHVISAIVSLARSFDILTVAEGVEDPQTLELLAVLGVDQAQGCHLGPPRPVDECLLRAGVARR